MAGRRLHLFSYHGRQSFHHPTYQAGDVLVFGPESVGLPAALVAAHGGGLRIPMDGPIRSLNLANAVAVATYRALMDVAPALFEEPA